MLFRSLIAAVLCLVAGFVPIVGWRWNVIQREEPREAGEVLLGFLLAGTAALGVLAGLVLGAARLTSMPPRAHGWLVIAVVVTYLLLYAATNLGVFGGALTTRIKF